MQLSPMSRLFSFFETSYQPGFIATSKVIANTVPRTAITRNSNERKEVLFNEITQGSTLFVALPITSAIANPIQSKLAGVSKELIKTENSKAVSTAMIEGGEALANKVKAAKLGKSIGASLFIAALLVATSYLRNYRTIKRTGFSDYKKVVGLGGNVPPTPEEKIKADKAAQKNLNIIKGLVVGGALAWLGTMVGFGRLAQKGGAVFEKGGFLNPNRLKNWMQHWAFVGKNNNQINGIFNSDKQTLWVWGIPSFAGWFLGCRDKFEFIEQSSKFATFWAGYIGTKRFINKFMFKKERAKLAEAAGGAIPATYKAIREKVANGQMTEAVGKQLTKFKNKNWLTLTGMNFFIAGVMPLVFNIFFSKWRYAREHGAGSRTQYEHPGGQISQQLNFRQWLTQVQYQQRQTV